MIKIPGITCRKAQVVKDDIKSILMLSLDFYREFIGQDEDNFKYDHVAQLARTIINSPDSGILLVFNKGTPIGMAFICLGRAYFNPDIRITEAHQLYLLKEYRQGSAIKVLVNTIREWAKNKKAFWLRDSRGNNSIKYKIYNGDKESWQTHLQPQQ
jgi:hypothetical protein